MLSSPFKTALLLWGLAEVLVFALAVHFAGLGWTMLAEAAATALGFFLLKRTGAAAMLRLRAAFQGRPAPGQAAGAEVVDGALSVLGALALVLPGFLSDLFGLALLVRAVRIRLAALLSRGRLRGWIGPGGGLRFTVRRGGQAGHRMAGGRKGSTDTIDLPPDEWRSGDTAVSPKLRP